MTAWCKTQEEIIGVMLTDKTYLSTSEGYSFKVTDDALKVYNARAGFLIRMINPEYVQQLFFKTPYPADPRGVEP